MGSLDTEGAAILAGSTGADAKRRRPGISVDPYRSQAAAFLFGLLRIKSAEANMKIVSSERRKELNQKRTELYGQIKKLADEFNTGGEKWADGEKAKTWEKVNADYDVVVKEMKDSDAVASRLAQVEEFNSAPINPNGIGLDNAGGGRVGNRRAPGATNRASRAALEQARCAAVDGWIRMQLGGEPSKDERRAARQVGLNLRARALRFALPQATALNSLRNSWLDHRLAHRNSRPFEYNAALTTTIGSTGGNIIPPETLMTSLEVNMLAYGAVRRVAEQIVTGSGEPMSWPTFDDTSNEGRQIPENTVADDNAGTGTTGDFGPNPSFGKITWQAYKFTSDALGVPYELIEDAQVPLVPIIGPALGERLGRITNRRFTTGSGAGEPQGIVNASALGVTAAGAAAITADELIDLEHAVDAAYRDGAGYMFHDLVLAHLRKLKASGTGEYIWQSNYNSGAPDTINARPYEINNHMATLATGNKTVIFGNFSKYKVRRVNQVRLYRLEERYRESDKDGFVAFVREDGGLLTAGTAPVKYLVQA